MNWGQTQIEIRLAQILSIHRCEPVTNFGLISSINRVEVRMNRDEDDKEDLFIHHCFLVRVGFGAFLHDAHWKDQTDWPRIKVN